MTPTDRTIAVQQSVACLILRRRRPTDQPADLRKNAYRSTAERRAPS
jgi:hypothetical protein